MERSFWSAEGIRSAIAASLSLVIGIVSHGSALAQTPKADSNQAAFVASLLKRMTLDEKIGQMSQIALNTPDSEVSDDLARSGKVGSFLFVTDAVRIDHLQHLAVEQSRLHIPILFGFDVIHGFRTVYPVPLAMAASWDPDLEERSQHMAAREAAAVGVRWTFAPMVDIARDGRWGRIMEGAGEDPFLGSRMAEAQVRGFQGASLSVSDSIAACVKHFAGYGAGVGGRDYDSSDISDADLQNIYLPPFKAAERAGAGTFMTAYMDLNGVPGTGNKWLLRDVLKDKWNFQGFVVSDWNAVHALVTHGFAKDDGDAAVRAVNAGVDMEMTGHVFREKLAAQVKSGAVSEAEVDDAVRRILSLKYQLGLFEHPYANPSAASAQLVTSEQRTAARQAAVRSAVLLRNQGDLLPLRQTPKTIAIIGALADSKVDIGGSWSLASHPTDNVTVLEGIRRRYAATPEAVRFEKGVEIERGQQSIFDEQFPEESPTLVTADQRKAAFQRAIELVKSSDVSVLVLGEAQNMSGERASRSTLDLPGRQEELLEAAVATGKPVILVLLNGRPLAIDWAASHVPAILEAWYPGTEGGDAVADLLFGDAVPGGKLPVTFPRSVGQEPLFYARYLTQIPDEPDTRYWDGSSAPLYPFGFGLSYSKFTISNLRLNKAQLTPEGSVEASVEVSNRGSVAADEVVQLYTHQRAGSASRPVRELKGFRRVTVVSGETRVVTLTLDAAELKYWSAATRSFVLEPGTFDVWVGDDSVSSQNHAIFELTK